MRLSRSLLSGVVGSLTVLFIVFNARSPLEIGLGVDPTELREAVRQEEHDARERLIPDVQVYRHVTPSLAELGARRVLSKTNENVLMVTRVPEAGAELLVLILQRLQGFNAFKHIRLPPGDHGILSTLQQELLVEEITSIIRQEAIPLSFDGDVRFLNFSKFGRQAPSFISIVRNPIDARSLRRYEKEGKNYSYSGAIAHFCGQDIRCTEKNSKWALQRAKSNVLEWYPVVGILEYMEQTLTALQSKFPYFFGGASGVYKRLRPTDKHLSDEYAKSKQQSKNALKKILTDEIEFYQWLKFRLLNKTSGYG
ncbi:hypothetical protein KM043_008230 [Ampulex compressa]|nr:hypothetical protein KM043_008230 [Ampulex compressa]